jgi:hypothetical protein
MLHTQSVRALQSYNRVLADKRRRDCLLSRSHHVLLLDSFCTLLASRAGNENDNDSNLFKLAVVPLNAK